MKTFLPALGVLMSLSSPQALADVLGLTVGAEWWQANPDGRMGDTGYSQPLKFDDDSHSAFYASFEHPIPLLPNLLMRRQTLSFQGDTVLAGELRLFDTRYAARSLVNNELSVEYTDASFYYELLDNDIVSLDMGLTARFFTNRFNNPSGKFGQLKACIHANAYAYTAMPASAFLVLTPVCFLPVTMAVMTGSSMSDLRAGFAYEWIDLAAFSLTVKLGVQRLELELNNEDRMDADLFMDGAIYRSGSRFLS